MSDEADSSAVVEETQDSDEKSNNATTTTADVYSAEAAEATFKLSPAEEVNANANANSLQQPSTYPSQSPMKNMKRSNTTGGIESPNASKTLVRCQSDRGIFQGQGIDAHPYARGSVIEVLFGAMPKKSDGSDEDDEDEDDEGFDDFQDDEKHNSETDDQLGASQEVRLADIIDRAPSKTPDHEIPCYRWKYYIHYRESNRRMDEWIIDPTRLVSPPSVGNAKVRALKKAKVAKQEEERKARHREKREREREQSLALAEVQGKRRKMDGEASDGQNSPLGRPVSQRASSRRASAAIAASSTQSTAVPSDTEGGQSVHTGSALDEQERLRLTRSQRRKSSRGAGNTDEDEENVNQKDGAASSTVVTTLIPDNEMIQDKVVTVAAQEIDEHEGLDEASLREHEEVTKVKNVHEVELGRYKMVRHLVVNAFRQS